MVINMIKTYKVDAQFVLDELKEKLDEITVDGMVELDVDEDLIHNLTEREIEIFKQKAAVLKLIAAIQEDM